MSREILPFVLIGTRSLETVGSDTLPDPKETPIEVSAIGAPSRDFRPVDRTPKPDRVIESTVPKVSSATDDAQSSQNELRDLTPHQEALNAFAERESKVLGDPEVPVSPTGNETPPVQESPQSDGENETSSFLLP